MNKSQFWKNVSRGSCGCLVFASVLLMIVLLSVTVKTVEQSDYAVGYDNYTMEFTKVYTQGKYVTKVREYLIKLPRTLQEYGSTITCLTKDKVLVNLEFTMQFQYNRDTLESIILRNFEGKVKYNTFLENRVLSSLMDTCLKYEAEEYYTSRGQIDIDMYGDLTKIINDKNLGSTVEFFQLVNIGFPKDFSDVITKKQTVQQEALTATNDRQSILTNAQTSLYEAERTASITLINANNTALIILNKALADSEAQSELWQQRSFGYGHTQTILELNGTEMIDYIETDNVKKSSVLVSAV
jgi:regulator of protease activity HflC (stomatin/prohibitin superfamily)